MGTRPSSDQTWPRFASSGDGGRTTDGQEWPRKSLPAPVGPPSPYDSAIELLLVDGVGHATGTVDLTTPIYPPYSTHCLCYYFDLLDTSNISIAVFPTITWSTNIDLTKLVSDAEVVINEGSSSVVASALPAGRYYVIVQQATLTDIGTFTVQVSRDMPLNLAPHQAIGMTFNPSDGFIYYGLQNVGAGVNEIHKLNPTTAVDVLFCTIEGTSNYKQDMKWAADGYLYVLHDTFIDRIDSSGTLIKSWTIYTDNSASNHMSQPFSIEINAAGTVAYISDWNDCTIHTLDLTGAGSPTVSLTPVFAGTWNVFGNTTGTGTAAKFGTPSGLIFDGGKSNLYMTDQSNGVITAITVPGAVVTRVAGPTSTHTTGDVDGTGTTVRLNSPSYIARVSDTEFYFSDTGNNKVKKFNPSTGEVSTVIPSTRIYQGTIAAGPVECACDGASTIFVTGQTSLQILKFSV